MAKIQKNEKSKLSIEDAPFTRKRDDSKREKLGLVSKKRSKMQTYRLRLETIDALKDLTNEANKHSNIKLSATSILEIIILGAARNPINKVLELLSGHDNMQN